MSAAKTGTQGALTPPKGMTLRDYFAACALTGAGGELLAKDTMELGYWNDSKEIARRCYQIADAMLAARKART